MFSIHVTLQAPRTRVVSPRFSAELDDFRSVLHFVCEVLAREPANAIVVTGFGLDWRLDISTDFCALLEQLPSAIQALRRSGDFQFDFYEQGVERRLAFRMTEDDAYLIKCSPMVPPVRCEARDEVCSRQALLAMLVLVQSQFVSVIQSSFPVLYRHPWTVGWLTTGGDVE
ncbi:MAG: hypothetical protein Q8L14_16730 [Myxococcales bacterium]|nr:hypothetical protein [Myxococcales bacterium]